MRVLFQRRVIVIALLVLSVYSCSFAQAEPLVFVCIDSMYPILYHDKGVIKGPLYEISKIVFNRLKTEVTIEILSFPLILRYLKEGNADGVLMIYKNEERKAFLLYPDMPLWDADINVYVKKGNEFTYRTVEDLYGRRVGNRTDFFVSDLFSKAVKENLLILDDAREPGFNLKKLQAGRIDCYVGDSWSTDFMIEQLDLENEIVALPTPIVPNTGLYMAITLNGHRIKEKKQFVDRLSDVIREMKKDGTLKRFDNR